MRHYGETDCEIRHNDDIPQIIRHRSFQDDAAAMRTPFY